MASKTDELLGVADEGLLADDWPAGHRHLRSSCRLSQASTLVATPDVHMLRVDASSSVMDYNAAFGPPLPKDRLRPSDGLHISLVV